VIAAADAVIAAADTVIADRAPRIHAGIK